MKTLDLFDEHENCLPGCAQIVITTRSKTRAPRAELVDLVLVQTILTDPPVYGEVYDDFSDPARAGQGTNAGLRRSSLRYRAITSSTPTTCRPSLSGRLSSSNLRVGQIDAASSIDLIIGAEAASPARARQFVTRPLLV